MLFGKSSRPGLCDEIVRSARTEFVEQEEHFSFDYRLMFDCSIPKFITKSLCKYQIDL